VRCKGIDGTRRDEDAISPALKLVVAAGGSFAEPHYTPEGEANRNA
jgi:hypothetical protein